MGRPSGKKFTKAFDKVWNLISESMEPGDMLPAEITLAANLGMNRQTVAKALNVLVSEGYLIRRPGAGTRLIRRPSTRKEGFLMVITAGGMGERSSVRGDKERLFLEINRSAMELGYPTLWISCQDAQGGSTYTRQMEALYSPHTTRGIVIADAYISAHDQLRACLQEVRCPIVWTWSSPPRNEALNRVDIDDRKAAFDLVEYLIEQGHREIACLSHVPNTIAREERVEGYRDALRKHGIGYRPELVIESDSNTLIASGRDCAALLLSRNIGADALFCTDEEVWVGAQQFLREVHNDTLVNLPLATFDATIEAFDNLVASVWQPLEELGSKTVELMDDLIYERRTGPVREILPHEFLTRKAGKPSRLVACEAEPQLA